MKSVATKPSEPQAKKAQSASTGSQQPAQTVAEKPFNPLWHGVATRTEAAGAAGDPTPPRTSRAAQPAIARPSPRNLLQCKLTVGAPNDPFEQEADRAAAVATSGGKVQLSSAMPASVSPSTASASGDGGSGQASMSGRISSADGGHPLSDGLRGD